MKSKKQKKRSLAAKKGWITRRARQNDRKASRRNVVRKRSKIRTKPRERFMYRVTIGAAYHIRKPGKKKGHKRSPESASYMVRGWYKTKSEAQQDVKELRERAYEGRSEIKAANSRAYVLVVETRPNIEVTAVPYEEELIGIIQETDERES